MSGFAVTVVIPLYNKARFIRSTLNSTLAQTHVSDEIVIVDDGSTDDSVERIAPLIGGPVRLVRQANAGPGPARNRGIAEAKSEWVAFLDADDLWQPGHLAALAEVAAAFPRAGVVASGYREIESPTTHTHPIIGEAKSRQIDYFVESATRPRLGSSWVAVRRELLCEIGGFGAFYPGEDVELWARLALACDIAVTDAVTTSYLRSTGGLMETAQSRRDLTFTLDPSLGAIDRYFDPGRHAHLMPSIQTYRASVLRRSLRQALYLARPDVARKFVRLIDSESGFVTPFERMLSSLPAPLLTLARYVRSWVPQKDAA